jgi:hypothetical protein
LFYDNNGSLFADGSNTLDVNITFYGDHEQPMCVHEDIQIAASMGQILPDSLTISNNQLYCQLQATTQIGTATISVFYKSNELGSKTIEMVAGPPAQLVFHCDAPVQEVDLSGSLISLQLLDSQGHPALISDNVSVRLNSTATTHAAFYRQKGDDWEWQDREMIHVFKPGAHTLMFYYKSAITGNFQIQASDLLSNYQNQLDILVIPHPLVFLSIEPTTITHSTDFQIDVHGEYITHYQYQLDQNEWGDAIDIEIPLSLSSLTDGTHTLNVVGKNTLGNWQNKATSAQLIIDTHVLPPDNLLLPSEYDSGPISTDGITNKTHMLIKGNCETGATVFLYDNDQFLETANIVVNQDSFEATIVLPEASHQITAIQQDAAGNMSQPSQALTITIDQKPPQVMMLSENNSGQSTQSKTWQWTANEPHCTFRYQINPYEGWTISGDFTEITSASISSVDGTWYLHVQARDMAGNISELLTVPTLLDNKPPIVQGLSNATDIIDSKTWYWNANENNCLFRYAIDQNPEWSGSGAFTQVTQTEKSGTFGNWYLHVQAQDSAGNHSLVKTVSAEFEKPMIEFINVRSEGYESENLIQLKLTLNRIVDRDVTVDYTIKESSSTAGEWSDFTLVNMCLEKICHETIVKGEKEGLIQLSIINDYTIEDNESIVIELVSSNVNLGRKNTYEYTIMNDDDRGISIAPSNSLILTEGTAPESLTMVLSSKPQQSVEIEIQYNATQRIKITPTALKLKSEQWNVPQVFTIETIDDSVYKGDEDLEIEFKVSNTLDDDYKELSQKIWIHLKDDENPPLPPEISCPQSPTNKSSLEFSWDSGGGTNLFRTKFDNNTMPDTDSNTFRTSVLNDGFHQFVVREFNEFTNNWSDDAICDIEIDTGKPCTDAQAVLNLNADSMTIEITYTYADIYADETCACENPFISGSGVQKVELWVAEPSESGNKPYSRYQTDEGNQIDGHFEFPATIEGRYRFITRAMDAAGNYEIDQLPDPENIYDSEIVFAENFSGYAILAVGAVGDEGLDSHTLSANNIYKHLINRHFGIMHQMNDPLDHIKYLNTRAQTGVDETQTSATYLAALEHAIKQWALPKMTRLPGPLYIILIDHGSPDHFYLGDNTTTLSSATLNKWISELENKLKPNTHEIVIVMDTCYSGSFMDELSASGRIIITSTAENEVSFRGPKTPSDGFVRDGAFFASNLFNELSKGLSLSDSFVKATYLTEMLTSSNIIKPSFPFYDKAAQHPLINDNGNGKGQNTIYSYGNGFISDTVVLGYKKESTDPVEIVDVKILPDHRLSPDEKSCTFKVSVKNQQRVEELCVEIRSPSTLMPTFVDDYRQKILELKQICLEYDNNEKMYVGSYNELIDSGKYSFYFYVEDTDNIITYFDEISVYKNQIDNAPPKAFVLYKPNNLNEESELQHVIFEWENTKDPNPFTYSLFLSKSSQFDDDPKLTIIKENIIDEQMMMKLPGSPDWSWDNSDIYWKVRAIDEFGAFTDTETYMFKTNYDNSPSFTSKSPVVFVHVYDKISKFPVPGAGVNFISNTTTIDLTMRQSGRYIERFSETGHYQVTIAADGYETIHESVDITESINTPLNFGISYTVQTGDLNRNKTIDIGDAIMCLQFLSDIQMNDYYYDEAALIGNDVGLRDAIFILRKLGFSDL